MPTPDQLSQADLNRIGEAYDADPPTRDFESCDRRDYSRSSIGRRCPRRGQWYRLAKDSGKVLHVFRCPRHVPRLDPAWTVEPLGPTPEHVTRRAAMIARARFIDASEYTRGRYIEALHGGRAIRSALTLGY